MSSVRFTATSLRDIADHFRLMADSHTEQFVHAKSQRAQRDHQMISQTYEAAADMLDNCELMPALAVIS